MAGETIITVVGNLTDDPELRFTPSGAAVANFTVASTPRTLNKQTNEWEDGEAMFLRCSIWRQAAENVAESLQKGARVIVNGRMRARSWEDREGNKRTSFEIDVDEIGPSLKFATAKVARAGRSGGGGGGGATPVAAVAVATPAAAVAAARPTTRGPPRLPARAVPPAAARRRLRRATRGAHPA